MTNLELVKLVFPNILVEQEGNAILVDNFIRIAPCQMEDEIIRINGRTIAVIDGWCATAELDPVEGYEVPIDEDVNFNEVVIATAKWYAGYLAENVIENNT